MTDILERLIRVKGMFYDPLNNEFGSITYKSDLKQRATDFKKHYDINSKFIYDGSDLFKDNKSILKFEKGLPYNWIIQENVTKQ